MTPRLTIRHGITTRLVLALAATLHYLGATPQTFLIDLGHDTQTTAGNWNNFLAGQGGNPSNLSGLVD
ncbi:MAG: hypothetical protein ACO3RV_08980, partial [Luteolibacter sp.]